MSLSTHSEPEHAIPLARFLREHRERILRRWSERVAERVKPARDLSEPLLRDHMPVLLEHLATALESGQSRSDALDEIPIAHALERLDEGFDLRQVATEYRLLRKTIMLLLAEAGARPASMVETQLFHEALDHAITSSIEHYATARNKSLAALDRISEVALASEQPELESFLERLLTILMETTAAVDSVSILLLEPSGQLRVRAAVGTQQAETRGQTVPVGVCVAGEVARTRRPLLLRHAAVDPRITSSTIDPEGVRALYLVPLQRHDRLIGVAAMGSRTSHTFTETDLLLFRSMGDRATLVIAQAELAEREARLRELTREALAQVDALLDSAPAGIAFLDPELRYGRINAWLARANGKPLAEHLGRPVSEVLPPEMAVTVERALREVIATGAPVRGVQFEKELPDGTVRQHVADYFPVAAGEKLIGIGAVVLDETERRAAQRELGEREQHFRALADNMAQQAWMADASGSLYWFNQRFYEFTGATLEEARGEGWRRYHHPDHLQRVVEKLYRHFCSGEEWEDTFPLRGVDGEYRWFLSRMFPIRDEAGKVLRWYGTNTDITDRMRDDEFRDRLVGIVSHDLRNPLSVIRTASALLLRAEGLPERMRKTVNRIDGASLRMARMISDLLDFTRGRLGGGLPVLLAPVDLVELARRIVDEFASGHPDRDFRFSASGRAVGDWDSDRIAQALNNLLENAWRYGDPVHPVEIRLEASEEGVKLSVMNRGVPIPPALLPHLFEPFRRATDRHQREGLGLGLYITQLIADAHGGAIHAASTEAGETTFTLVLPLGSP